MAGALPRDGHPSWTRDERFATLLARKAHEDELERRLGEWARGWDAHALMRTLQQAGVPARVVRVSREVIEDAQLAHRGHFVFMEHPDLGHHPVQRSEFRLSGDAGLHRWPAPNIGQRTVQVCEEFLGMSRDEIDALVAEDILEVDRAEEAPSGPLPDVG